MWPDLVFTRSKAGLDKTIPLILKKDIVHHGGSIILWDGDSSAVFILAATDLGLQVQLTAKKKAKLKIYQSGLDQSKTMYYYDPDSIKS